MISWRTQNIEASEKNNFHPPFHFLLHVAVDIITFIFVPILLNLNLYNIIHCNLATH